ncbi:hypothetical protein FPQ18DRAFT_116352 [Pyronema domesticum]|nr:hypothetical protein FPQ18DRAFT_116352 [Pyronema domesticum]
MNIVLLDALRFDNRRYGNISTQDSRTLEWIWADIQYTKWRDSEKSCLFHVQGKPGSGKSTFMKYFGNNLIKQPHVPRNAVVSSFFYSDRIEGDGQTSHYSMLRKILYDILEQNESFFYHFQSEFRRHQLDSCFSYESLQSILRSIGRNHDQRETIFLLIDAVDESSHEDRQHILQLLIDVCSENGFCTVKIVFASRPVPILDSLVRNASSFLRMQDVNTSDIEGYVSAFLIQLDFSENLLQKARNYILKQAHGVFLWVCLVKDRLIKCAMEGARNHEIISTLEGLPTELEGMYKLMLGNLSSDQRHTIDRTRIFELVLFAARPLRISEMNHALATADVLDHTSTEEISWETFENSLSAGIKAKIIGCGGNLLELKGPTEEDPMVQLMHQTVRDFMLGDNGPARSLNIHLGPESNANHRIVVLCLRYLIVCIGNLSKLQHPSFNHWSGETFISFVKFLNERCFLSYIFSHLGDHMKASSVKTPEITALMGDFRDLISKDRTTQSLLGGWLSANFIGLFPEQDFNEDILSNFKSSLLCCAAMNNLIVATRTLLTLGARPHKVKYFDSKCQTDQNPAPLIILAIAMHFNDVVLLLLEYMPDLINLFWDGHRSLLHHAIEHANETIMNFLLDSGHVSIDSTNGIDYTACSALLYACHNPNQPGPIKLLLDRGADRDMSSGGYISPLSYSSLHGHENVVRLLLDHGADVNLSYNFFGVPLHYAAKNGQENIVKILMHHGANINSKSADGGPLHYASFHGHERTVRTLLDYGADINMCSEFDGSPLHCAVSAGWESIVRLLLQRGADVNIKTTLLGTPLAVALGTKVIRSSVIVDTLLSYGAVFAEC